MSFGSVTSTADRNRDFLKQGSLEHLEPNSRSWKHSIGYSEIRL
jgi:hypothetical protein